MGRHELWNRPRGGWAVQEQPADPAGGQRLPCSAGLAPDRPRCHGQDSLLAAEESHSWLGTLAVEPKRISLRNDLSTSESLQLEVVCH